MKYIYEAVFTPNEKGGFDAEIPDLDIVTEGASLKDAVYMAQDAMEGVIVVMLRSGRSVPEGRFGHRIPNGGYVIGVMADCDEDTPDVETMSVQEAADILGVSTARIYAMIRDGVLDGEKVGNARMVSASSVMKRFNEPRGAGRPAKDSAMA